MHKILVAVLMALVLTLALVGVKSIAQDNAKSQPKTMMAEGGAPAPPIPW
jgi:hypothetical protein